jgi:Uma2 family endonuclease
MSALTLHDALVSPEDYLEGELNSPVKHEYLGGNVHAMAGAQNVHNRIAGSTFLALASRLRGKKCEPFNSDTKVRVRLPNQLRFYYPDLQVVCDPNPPDDSFQDRPVVIVEVLSESTRRVDESEKLDAYLTIPTLEAYLLIDATHPCVVVHQRTDSGFKRVVYGTLEHAIKLDYIGVELPLAEIYERVDFPDLSVVREPHASV